MEKPKYTVFPCPGEAHSNAFIDNCGLCAPLWGEIVLPARFSSLDAWRDAYAAEPVTGRPALTRERKRAMKAYAADHAR